MATLTAVTNKSTVLAVQQIQALIAELNEAIEREPLKEDILEFTKACFESEDFDLNIKGHIVYFQNITSYFGVSDETKQKALKLSELFKLFEE